jgi:hypothetical protein
MNESLNVCCSCNVKIYQIQDVAHLRRLDNINLFISLRMMRRSHSIDAKL